MGGGIAQILALAGCTVQIADISAEIAESNLKRIIAEAAEFEEAGLFAAGSTEIIRTNITAAQSMEEAIDGADFIEEAVPETIPIKKETLARISAAASPQAIIGSNTSTIPLTTLAEAVAGVPLSMAPKASQDAIEQFGRPTYAKLIADHPMALPLEAQRLVYAFQRWDQQVGVITAK